MDRISQIEENIKSVLLHDADELGRETGFIRRQRKLTGSHFVNILVWGSMDNPALSYSDMSQDAVLAGVSITAQGLEQRFTEVAARFMKQVLDRSVEKVIQELRPTAIPILQRFRGVYIRDSSIITLPPQLKDLWPGCGGSEGESAAMKIQIRLDYSSGRLEGPALQAGREHDRHTPFGPDEPPGSLTLSDLGYFSLDELQQRDGRGQYFITRYKVGTALFDCNGERFDLIRWLSSQEGNIAEVQLLLGAKHRLSVRLIAYRLTQQQADRRRRRLKEYARKKQVMPKKESLILAGWLIVLTNLPVEELSAQEILTIGRVRWQVEILFRVWKSEGFVDKWRSENPWRILCEIYAKFIGLLMTHWILLTRWYLFPDLSLAKVRQAVGRLAISFLLALREGISLRPLLEQVQELIEQTCRMNKRRAHPATFQILLALGDS